MTMYLQEKTTVLSLVALEGAVTRDGGHVVILEERNGLCILGKQAAVVGDVVHYPDGRTAKISRGSVAPVESDGQIIALVGSELDNGDVIVSTLHHEVYAL